MKSKLGLTDTIAMVRDMQRYAGMKVVNVYNLNRRVYLIRLQNKSMGKRVLLIESGTRMHTTRYSRTKPPMPSAFAMKLRKHIRGKHLNSVTQLGLDRIVVMRFGLGEGAFNVIVELYGQGNIVLTDSSFKVLSLLRVVDATAGADGESGSATAPTRGKRGGSKPSKAAAEDASSSDAPAAAASGEGERVWRVGAPYPVAFGARDRGGLTDRIARSLPSVAVVESMDALKGGGTASVAEAAPGTAAAGGGGSAEAAAAGAEALLEAPAAAVDLDADSAAIVPQLRSFLERMAERPAPVRKQRARHTLRSTLASRGSGMEIFGTDLIDHAVTSAGLSPLELVCRAPVHGKGKKGKGKAGAKEGGGGGYALPSDEALAKLADGLRGLPGVLREIGLSSSPTAYIVVKRKDGGELPAGPIAVGEGADVLGGFDDEDDGGDGDAAEGGAGGSDGKGDGEGKSGSEADGGDASAAGGGGDGGASSEAGGAMGSGGEGTAQEAAGAEATGSKATDGDSGSKQPVDPFAAFDFVEVCPALLSQHAGRAYIAVPSFDRALDEYFTRVDAARADAAISGARTAAMARVDRAKADSEKRVGELKAEQERAGQWGYLIQSNLPQVDATIKTLRSALDSGMNWGDLERLVEAEREKGNPVARAIVGMDLPRRRATVMLRNWDVEVDEEEESDVDSEDDDEDDDEDEEKEAKEEAFEPVDVSIDLSAPANASEYFKKGRQAREKEERTVAAATETLKRLEKQADRDAEAAVARAHKQSGVVQAARKKAWWEKFAWFLSSDGLVVVAGKDAHQNEALVRKYLRPQDLYVHAEIHGAATVIVRSPLFEPEPGAGIPPSTLQQAGQFCICRSAAWKANRPTSAWWVFASQVSKTAQSGEYLSTGSFMIRGKKNFLHPARLELGLAIAFKVDEESALRRLAKRPPMRVQLGAVGAREGARESLTAASEASPGSEGEARGGARGGGGGGAAVDAPSAAAAAPGAATATAGGDSAPEAASRGTGLSTESVMAGQALPKIGGRRERRAEEEAHAAATKAAIQRKTDKLDQAQLERARAARERKRRKRLAKYRDQDDEDRLVAMEALGHPTAELRAKMRKEGGEEVDSDSEGDDSGGEGESGGPAMPEGATKVVGTRFVVSTGDPGGEEAAGGEGAAASGAGSGGALDAPPAAARHATSGGAAFDDEDEGDVFVQQAHGYTGEELNIAALVLEPKEGEVLLHAVPVAAPYATLADARYRAKLVPGAGKKGKSAKSVVQQMLGGKVHSAREKDLLRGLKDEELVQVMVGDVRITSISNTTKGGGKGGKGRGKGGKGKGGGKKRGK